MKNRIVYIEIIDENATTEIKYFEKLDVGYDHAAEELGFSEKNIK